MSQSAASTSKSHQLHVMPLKLYVAVGVALLVMTFITVEVAFHDLGSFNIIIALAIASVKALLVAFFFMHLWYDNKLFFIAFSIGVFTLTVFIVLTMLDTMERGQINAESKGPINYQAEMYSTPGLGQTNNEDPGTAAVIDSLGVDSTGAEFETITEANPDAVPDSVARSRSSQ